MYERVIKTLGIRCVPSCRLLIALSARSFETCKVSNCCCLLRLTLHTCPAVQGSQGVHSLICFANALLGLPVLARIAITLAGGFARPHGANLAKL